MSRNPGRAGAESSGAEKEFYLQEFRGRTLAIALAQAEVSQLGELERVLGELAANSTRCVLISTDRPLLEKLAGQAIVDLRDSGWAGQVWRGLREAGRVGIALAGADEFAPRCRQIALRLQFAKLVWIDAAGRLVGPAGEPMSLVDLSALDGLLEDPAGLADRIPLLREIRAVIQGGVPSVNLCSLPGLSDELFSYSGSGTFFTRERYILVRPLALDEFDAAFDLFGRGVDDGYLAVREPDELENLLAHAFGVFVEGRYLAGIGALLPYPEERAAEIAGLYTVSRFQREGVGGRLVRFARDEAASQGLDRLFACTTSPLVEGFFERHGFRRVAPDELPDRKWQGYDPERRASLRCLDCDLGDG